MVYETKPESIDNPNEKIYRVTNNFEFSSLCGAGRFGSDYENSSAYKDLSRLKSAVEALKKADTVRFSSLITNEEALILKRVAKSVGAKLVCDDAYGFSQFLSAYQKASGKTLWGATLKSLSKSDVIITLGSRIKDDAPMVKNHIAMAAKRQKARVIYMHPIVDSRINNLVTRFVKYEPGSEEGVVAMLLELLSRESEVPAEIKSFIDELDIGYLSGESAVSEEELEAIRGDFWKRKRFTLVVGEDIFNHPEVENIAALIAAIEQYSNFELLVVPPASNTLGLSLLCDLEKECSGYTVGYNAKGDFELSALGGADFDMPAMNQQEGTITTIDKRVVPLNVALGYDGYTLNDIANELGLGSRYTIDFTKELAAESSLFEAVEFDSLDVDFSATGEDVRGYALAVSSQEGSLELKEPDDLPSFDGVVIYNVNPAHNPNPFTQKAKLTKSEAKLLGTQQFATAAKLKEGDEVEFELDGNIVKRVFSIDTSLKGTIALNPTFDMGLSAFSVSSYRFSKININKVGSANE
ncbi:MAG TPA: hypothetical protein ENK87_03415 [Nitratifractor sp.]|nr:hypothetical protein [Nitratifractor sp.]